MIKILESDEMIPIQNGRDGIETIDLTKEEPKPRVRRSEVSHIVPRYHSLEMKKIGDTNKLMCKECDVPVCPICSRSFNNPLWVHMNQGLRVMCEKCKIYFTSYCGLMAHKALHGPPAPFYVCSDCGEIFQEKHNYLRHLLGSCCHLFRKDKFVCTICIDCSFSSYSPYEKHVKKHLMRSMSCKCCKKKVGNPIQLLKHLKNHHSLTDYKHVEDLVVHSKFCDYCQQCVSYQLHWQDHLGQPITTYECPCKASFETRRTFQIHRKVCSMRKLLPLMCQKIQPCYSKKPKLPSNEILCGCTEFWQTDLNSLICKGCDTTYSNRNIHQVAKDSEWLGAEEIENEEDFLETCELVYLKIPIDHHYCLKHGFKDHLEKLANQKSNFTIVEEKVVAKETPPPSVELLHTPQVKTKSVISCPICLMKIADSKIDIGNLLKHFQLFHVNAVLSVPRKKEENFACANEFSEQAKQRPLGVTSSSEPPPKRLDGEESLPEQVALEEPLPKRPALEESSPKRLSCDEALPVERALGESPPNPLSCDDVLPVERALEESPPKRSAYNELSPEKSDLEESSNDSPSKPKEYLFWDKFYDALPTANSYRVSVDKKIELLDKINTPKRREVKKPKRFNDDILDLSLIDDIGTQNAKASAYHDHESSKENQKSDPSFLHLKKKLKISPKSKSPQKNTICNGISSDEKEDTKKRGFSPSKSRKKLKMSSEDTTNSKAPPMNTINYQGVTLEGTQDLHQNLSSLSHSKKLKISSKEPSIFSINANTSHDSSSEEAQDTHQNGHLPSNPKKEKCFICNAEFENTADHFDHLTTHLAKGSKFECSECGNHFVKYSGLKNHLSINHGGRVALEPSTKSSSPDLPRGSKSGETGSSIPTVKGNVKTDDKVCKICKENFANPVQMQLHFRRKHGLAFLKNN